MSANCLEVEKTNRAKSIDLTSPKETMHDTWSIQSLFNVEAPESPLHTEQIGTSFHPFGILFFSLFSIHSILFFTKNLSV